MCDLKTADKLAIYIVELIEHQATEFKTLLVCNAGFQWQKPE